MQFIDACTKTKYVSDLHKDAFGFRPDETFWAEWNKASSEERLYIWDQILTALQYSQDIQEE